MEKITMYCVRCREKKEVEEYEKVVLKNGRHAVKSVCPVCSTKMFKFVKSEENVNN